MDYIKQADNIGGLIEPVLNVTNFLSLQIKSVIKAYGLLPIADNNFPITGLNKTTLPRKARAINPAIQYQRVFIAMKLYRVMENSLPEVILL